MKTYKIGIIGVHGRGRHAWAAHRPEQGFEIVMGADPCEPASHNTAYMPGITPACRRGNAGISQGYCGSHDSLRIQVLVCFPMKYPHRAQEEILRLLSGPPEKEIGKIQRAVPNWAKQ